MRRSPPHPMWAPMLPPGYSRQGARLERVPLWPCRGDPRDGGEDRVHRRGHPEHLLIEQPPAGRTQPGALRRVPQQPDYGA